MADTPSTSPSDAARMRWLWTRFCRPYVWLIALALAFMVVQGSVLGAISYMMEPMFDRVLVAGESDALWFVGGGIFALFVIRAVSNSGQRVTMKYVGEKVQAAMRMEMLSHTLKLDADFHATHPPGYMIERVQGDALMIITGATGLVTGIGRDTVSLIVLMIVAINVDPLWTLIAVGGAPLVVAPSLLVQGYIRRKSLQAREVAARMSLRLDEIYQGISTVKLNRLEGYQTGRYGGENKARVETETKSEFGRTLMPGMIDIITGLGFLGVLIYGGAEIISGEKTVGQFMSFFTAMALAFDPVRRLANLNGLLKTVAASLERVQEILDETPSISSPASPNALEPGDIVFDDVSVQFGAAFALNGLSFTARKGQTTALVGASGAGKSTVFNALTRLVPLQGGEVRLGCTDITAAELSTLRGTFSVVSQEALLFDDSLRDNIVFDDTPSAEALDAALANAHVTDFLPSLPKGIDSPAGPRGSNISGGQRQRVAIARALLRDAPVLLLDEATSALDAESEVKVQAALETLSEGRTTLVIAHRLSTIRDADKIVVMERGRAVEEGTHDELIAKGGAYARLHALQFKD
ncbi:MAG: ABC transporter ATP-binding protein/permease [Rhodobacteraceae bacterium]|nr:ABC transporter ATP-binding protein/permease [Paracoccaceae bacterium]